MIQCTVFLLTIGAAVVLSDVSPGQNAYLPPNKGYNYDRPNQGFPNNQNNIQVPFPQQPPFQQQRPSIPNKPYQPPTNTYRPPTGGYPPAPGPTGPTGGYQPPRPGGGGDDHDHHHHEPGMPFDFNYSVQDAEHGNDYSHNAVSDGDVTKGEYRVQLPDGRLQIVRYTADWKNGFNAEVTYEGQAKYPDQPQGYGGGQPAQNYGPPNNNLGGGGGYKY